VTAIVAAHGGRVEAGQNPGGGAAFTIHLPVAQTAADPVKPLRSGDDSPEASGVTHSGITGASKFRLSP
jgi:hypothetical protein